MSAYLPVKQSTDQVHINVETFFAIPTMCQTVNLSTCQHVYLSTCPSVDQVHAKVKNIFYNIFIAPVCLHVDTQRLYVFEKYLLQSLNILVRKCVGRKNCRLYSTNTFSQKCQLSS